MLRNALSASCMAVTRHELYLGPVHAQATLALQAGVVVPNDARYYCSMNVLSMRFLSLYEGRLPAIGASSIIDQATYKNGALSESRDNT